MDGLTRREGPCVALRIRELPVRDPGQVKLPVPPFKDADGDDAIVSKEFLVSVEVDVRRI
jgi:hypothetical protein